jgi:hypothetical protein
MEVLPIVSKLSPCSEKWGSARLHLVTECVAAGKGGRQGPVVRT